MTTAPLPTSLRTEATERRYQEAKLNGTLRDLIDIPPIWAFEYWIVVPNDFPSDMVYSVHDIIVPKREFPNEEDMTLAEKAELDYIHKEIGIHYMKREENYASGRSVKNRYHQHLVRLKPREGMGE